MVFRTMPFKVVKYALSDIGLVRQNNEDVWAELPEHNVFILADGMGGHQAGEIAAKEAVNSLCENLEDFLNANGNSPLSKSTLRQAFKQSIEQANKVVYRMGRSNEVLKGMGTTICCLQLLQDCVVYAHVGDSRIYRLRNKKLEQLTKDHSLLRELMDLGKLNEKQAEDFLYKNIITKAIGTEPIVEPTIQVSDLYLGDVYLLCSDGLSDLLSLEEMEKIMNGAKNIEDSVHLLISQAKEKGGYDNITVILVGVKGDNVPEGSM